MYRCIEIKCIFKKKKTLSVFKYALFHSNELIFNHDNLFAKETSSFNTKAMKIKIKKKSFCPPLLLLFYKEKKKINNSNKNKNKSKELMIHLLTVFFIVVYYYYLYFY